MRAVVCYKVLCSVGLNEVVILNGKCRVVFGEGYYRAADVIEHVVFDFVYAGYFVCGNGIAYRRRANCNIVVSEIGIDNVHARFLCGGRRLNPPELRQRIFCAVELISVAIVVKAVQRHVVRSVGCENTVVSAFIDEFFDTEVFKRYRIV